jgi:threonine aldolase
VLAAIAAANGGQLGYGADVYTGRLAEVVTDTSATAPRRTSSSTAMGANVVSLQSMLLRGKVVCAARRAHPHRRERRRNVLVD